MTVGNLDPGKIFFLERESFDVSSMGAVPVVRLIS